VCCRVRVQFVTLTEHVGEALDRVAGILDGLNVDCSVSVGCTVCIRRIAYLKKAAMVPARPRTA
jgi:hypothetical protein